MNRDAFLVESHLVEGRGVEALMILFDDERATVEGALADLLEQTAAVLRLHDLDFDAYIAERCNVDPEFEARVVAVFAAGKPVATARTA